MDKKTIISIGVCLLAFIAWQNFLAPKSKEKINVEAISKKNSDINPATKTNTSTNKTNENFKEPAQATKELAQSRIIDTPIGQAEISNGVALITNWKLKDYHLDKQKEKPIDLKSVILGDSAVHFYTGYKKYNYLQKVLGKMEQNGKEILFTYKDENIELKRKIWQDPGDSFLEAEYQATFKTRVPDYVFLSLFVNKGDESEALDRKVSTWAGNELEEFVVSEEMEQKQEIFTPISWIAAMNRYFTLAIVPRGSIRREVLVQPLGDLGTTGRLISLRYPVQGNTINIPFRLYFGPKDLDLLRKVDPTLDHVVDFGWFTVIAYPILRLMSWFHSFFGNWGIAIILLTLLLKIVTYPLTYKSMKSMRQMSKLQPEIQKLKEKHGDNKEAMNKEMMIMMKSRGYNPMAGCLPILVQMPVFFALYRVLYSSVELYQAPFYFWITDLSLRDPFYVTPVLLCIVMFLQQKLTPTPTADPMQKKMMMMMPFIFGAFMVTLPSGLTIYMLTNAVASILQQVYLNKKLDDGGKQNVVAAAT